MSETDELQVAQLRHRFGSSEDDKLSLVSLMLKYYDIIKKEYTRDE